MSTVDHSVFNASQTAFQHQPPALENALRVTDLEPDAAEKQRRASEHFRGVTGKWETVHGGEFATVRMSTRGIPQVDRDLPAPAQRGMALAVQFGRAFGCVDSEHPPVAILPHPDREGVPDRALKNTDSVMVINSHLVGEDALVNHAAVPTAIGGTLHLTHVEDDVFERYLDVISKIPEIDTDVARETIQEQLYANPRSTLIPAKPPARGRCGPQVVTRHARPSSGGIPKCHRIIRLTWWSTATTRINLP